MAPHVEDNAETCMFCGQQRLSHAPPFVNVTSLMPFSLRQTIISLTLVFQKLSTLCSQSERPAFPKND